MGRLTLYRRHTQSCKHQDDKFYQRCNCPVWFEANVIGRRWNTETNSWAQAPDESIQSRWSSKEKNWRSAAHKARQLEKQLEDIQQGNHQSNTTVKAAIDLFLDSKQGEDLSANTLYKHKLSLARLQEFCDREGILSIKDLTLSHLTTWRARWTLESPVAKRNNQGRVKSFFRFCLNAGLIATNPAAQISQIQVKADEVYNSVRALEPQEYETILSSIKKTNMTDVNKARIRALMQLQRWSGLSLVDAVCLSKDELREMNGIFRVVCDRQKTGTHINNVIPSWLGKELLSVKNGNPKHVFWNGAATPKSAVSSVDKLYRKVFKTAGIDGSSHDLRHTFAIELLKNDVDIRKVSRALGHSSVTITEKYYGKWCRAQQAMLDDDLTNSWGQ
jgi:integrase/recombinase XerD